MTGLLDGRRPATVALAVGLALATDVTAASSRRLATDCSFDPAFKPSESSPFEMDWCTLADGDDIRALLLDIANRWPRAIYLQAPSKTVTLNSDSINWTRDPFMPVRTFVMRETPKGNARLTLRHTPTSDPWRMWTFENYQTVRIGGSRLSMTFKGTHPGLGNGEGEQPNGLLTFLSTNGGTPILVDVRANFSDSRSKGIYIGSSVYGTTLGGTVDRVRQVNVSGEFWNSSVFVHSGVQNLWFDPDGLRVSDPYNRYYGWDGAVAFETDGRRVGCMDSARAQIRNGASAAFYYVDHAVGGVTFEYGFTQMVLRANGRIGNSPEDPFVVRIKDWGASGPESRTGLPSGVMVRKTVEANFHKGDDNYELAHQAPFRFMRVEMLRPDYGNGFWSEPIPSGCAPGNRTANADSNGQSNFWRFEANRGDQPTQNRNAYFDVELQGDFDHSFGDKVFRGPLLYTAFEPQHSPGPRTPDRSYGHVIRVGPGTLITDPVNLLDTITATGQGTWTDLTVAGLETTDRTEILHPRDNFIRDTSVAGAVRIDTDARNTRIENVRFVGAARVIVTIAEGSDASMRRICAPAGSSITGQGLLEYEGTPVKLPFVLRSGTGCTVRDR